MTATAETKIPWRYRRQLRDAEKKRDDEFNAAVHNARAELAAAPVLPLKQRVPLREREKLPVARPLMKNPKDEIRWAAGHVGNRTAHHVCRLDLHARTFWCAAGRGVARGTVQAWKYVTMPEGLVALHALAEKVDAARHAEHTLRYVNKKKAHRITAGSAAGTTLLVLVTLLAAFGWPLTLVGLFLAGPPALAVYGRRRGDTPAKLIKVDTRPVPKSDPRPSPELVHAAFHAVGIEGISCEVAPHREGPGWETTIRIPVGTKSFADAVKAHGTIAGNLGTGSEGLFLERGATEKHVIVWWSKQDPFAGDPIPHPVLDPRSGPSDLWNKGIRIGIDQRGSEVRIPAVDTPFMVIGGQQGAGKTFSLFGIGAEAGADPIWDLDCWSFKPSNDFAPLEPLVRACGGTFRYGADTKTFEAFLRYLKALRSEVIARGERLADLSYELNPRAKVERNVAADPKNGLRPRLVIADEIQSAIGHPGVLAELIEINRTFRSQNIVLIAGMQFVDSATIEQLQRLFGTRICLSVSRHEDSKGVLGGAHEPGVAEGHKIPLTAKAVAIVAGAIAADGQAPRGAFKMRHYGIESRQVLADHVTRCLKEFRADQGPRVRLVKDEDPFLANLEKALADGPVGVTALAEQLGYGEGLGAVRQFTTDARKKAGIEPKTETRDTGGVVARGVKYIDPEQLTGH